MFSFFFRILFKIRNRNILAITNNIFTHISDEEKVFLYTLSGKYLVNDKIAVEIGSYLGASALCIASGMGKGCTLYCVDTWKNDAMSEGTRDTYSEFIANTSMYPSIMPLRGKSADIAATFTEPVHFLFFDGDHTYDGIKTDIDAWMPKLAPNALVVCHDIGWAEGVQRVVKEDLLPRSHMSGGLPNLFWAVLR